MLRQTITYDNKEKKGVLQYTDLMKEKTKYTEMNDIEAFQLHTVGYGSTNYAFVKIKLHSRKGWQVAAKFPNLDAARNAVNDFFSKGTDENTVYHFESEV